ncbi:Putative ribonuclease H protein At1g65750 [Linum perenne]
MAQSRLSISLTQDLGKYLGVPVLHGKTTLATNQHVIDEMDNKLAGWKAKSLSLGGLVTLAHSVLSAIPAYAMQNSVLPTTTCSEIDRRIHNFIWDTSPGEHKTHLIAWDRICRPKDGGLDLKSARLLNRAYMTKLAFLFFFSRTRNQFGFKSYGASILGRLRHDFALVMSPLSRLCGKA